jgi:DNA-binding transcriptional ArsR family regulator
MSDPLDSVLEKVLKEDTRKKFVKTLLTHGKMDFKTLYTDHLKVSETNSRHHLKLLLSDGVVRKEKQKGTKAIYLRISPKFIERTRRCFNIESEYSYIGMVGAQSPETQIKDAIKRVRSQNWQIEKITAFTTEPVIKILEQSETWADLVKDHPGSTLIVTPLIELDETIGVMRQAVDELIYKYSVVADVTGLTKLHTLAMYIIAKDYGLHRVYLPKEDGNKVIFLP